MTDGPTEGYTLLNSRGSRLKTEFFPIPIVRQFLTLTDANGERRRGKKITRVVRGTLVWQQWQWQWQGVGLEMMVLAAVVAVVWGAQTTREIEVPHSRSGCHFDRFRCK